MRWLLLLCLPMMAQSLPSNWAGFGASLNQASRPPVAGWFSYALLISDKAQLFSYTTHDVFLSQAKPYTVQSSVRSGIATPVRKIGDCANTCLMALGLGDAGMSAGGSTLAGAFSGGGLGILKLGHTNWTLVAGGHLLKVAAGGGTQTLIIIGVGRTF